MLDHDAVHDIGDVVETVDHFLEMVIDLVADKEAHGIGLGVALIERLEADIVQLVGMIAVLVVLQVFQAAEGSRRATVGGDDAQNSGIIALTVLQRDLRQAGFGVSATAILGCDLDLPGGRSLDALAPVTINHADIPAGDANTDTLLVVYGSGGGSPEGDRVHAQPAHAVYAVATPTAFAAGDLVLAVPQTRPIPCDLRLEPALAIGSNPPQVTVATGRAAMTDGTLFNLGAAPQMLAYAVRGGNLTVCDLRAADCDDAALVNDRTVWVPIAANIVSLRAQYGRDTSGPPMDGVVDVFDQTTPTMACGWARTLAVRLVVVARSGQFERDVVTAAPPVWSGSATTPVNLTGLADWERFRYRSHETTVALRNLAWTAGQSGC